MSKVIIGADFVPTVSNKNLFINGQVDELIGKELVTVLKDSDYRNFNLEVPLTDNSTPIDKNGPSLRADTATIAGFKALEVNLFTLANNHILDQGEQGLLSTIKVLENNQINYVGVGTEDTASKPFFFEFNEKTIGVYACAEHEFSIVGDKFSIGANPFDFLNTFDEIAELKSQCDYVIVLYHGGKELYRYPSPNLQKVCRRLADKGADLVVCQHSHCIGCEENYKNSKIVYGQGNFLFDLTENEYWQTSLLISITENFEIEYIPLVKNGASIIKANDEHSKKILDDFYRRSEDIKAEGFIEKNYANFSKKYLTQYLMAISGIRYGFISKVLNKMTKGRYMERKIKRRFDRKKLLTILNYIECEAHRELLIKGLTNE